eukprot:1157360-Pelagomonas_calceolata.AAC.7
MVQSLSLRSGPFSGEGTGYRRVAVSFRPPLAVHNALQKQMVNVPYLTCLTWKADLQGCWHCDTYGNLSISFALRDLKC